MADDKRKNKDKNKTNKKSWFKQLRSELKKVTWLTPKELIKDTGAVLLIILIVTLIVFVCDLAFNSLDKQVVEKIKSFAQDNTEQVENTVVDSNSVDNSAIDNAIGNAMTEALNESINELDGNSTSEEDNTAAASEEDNTSAENTVEE